LQRVYARTLKRCGLRDFSIRAFLATSAPSCDVVQVLGR
jgi:hypothetical protein